METEDKRFDHIENEETKKIIQEMNDFIFPKFKDLQEKTSGLGPLKMIKTVTKFMVELKKEYSEKFGRELDDDMKVVNEHFGVTSQGDLMNLLKKL